MIYNCSRIFSAMCRLCNYSNNSEWAGRKDWWRISLASAKYTTEERTIAKREERTEKSDWKYCKRHHLHQHMVVIAKTPVLGVVVV